MRYRIFALLIATFATHISAAEFFVLPGTKTLLMMGETTLILMQEFYGQLVEESESLHAMCQMDERSAMTTITINSTGLTD